MNMNRKRLKRGALVVSTAGSVAILATGLIPVAAQVIGDPLGLISVGTSSQDNPSGSVLAVSNGGNASGGTNGAGVSTTGTATGGLVAVSGTGCAVTGNTYAYAPVAASGTGCAGGQGTVVSGTGPACGSGLVGVSVYQSSCGFVAVTGDGPASGTYSVNGSGAISAEGNSLDTGSLAVSAPGTLVMDEAGVAWRPVDDQLENVGYEPPADVTAGKAVALASIMPMVTAEMAQCAVSCTYASTVTTSRGTFSSCSTCPTPSRGSLPLPAVSNFHQNTSYTCGPSATRFAAWYINNSDPGEGTPERYQGNGHWGGGSGIAGYEHTHNETHPGDVVHGLGNYASRGGYWTEHQPKDADHLIGIVVEDVNYGATQSQSNPNPAPNMYPILLAVPNASGHKDGNVQQADQKDPGNTYLHYWSGYSSNGHYIPVKGYDLHSGGKLELYDEFDPSYGNGTGPWGDHWLPLVQGWNAMHGGLIIW
jgi:hypothetical protein